MTIHVGAQFGKGGTGINTTRGSALYPGLRAILGGLVADIAGSQIAAPIADGTTVIAAADIAALAADGSTDVVAANLAAADAATVGADLAAFSDPPNAGEMGALRTFANAIKVDVAAIRTYIATIVTLVNECKADYNLLRATVGDLRTVGATERTMQNELKADVNLLRLQVLDLRTKINTASAAVTVVMD